MFLSMNARLRYFWLKLTHSISNKVKLQYFETTSVDLSSISIGSLVASGGLMMALIRMG